MKILIVDDQAAHRDPLRDGLRVEGYQVLVAERARDGLSIATDKLPDVIILDVLLPDMSGLEVARQLRRAPRTRHIPIIIVTAHGGVAIEKGLEAGGTYFLQKPFRFQEVLGCVRRALEDRPPFGARIDETLLKIRCQDQEVPMLSITGVGGTFVAEDTRVALDPDSYAAEARSVLRDREWRRRAKRVGFEVYAQVFQKKILEKTKYFARPGAECDVRIRMQGPRSSLNVPFEMMFDRARPEDGGSFLVLKHPLSRYVTEVDSNRRPVSREFFNERASSGEALRVLLIGSNTKPSIPAVDAEIKALAKAIPREFASHGMAVDTPRVLVTADATMTAVEDALNDYKPHIVHYAGHGDYERNSPEESSLFFWSGRNRTGTVERLTAAALASLLAHSSTSFVYLSCCSGTASGPPAALLDDDFLGIADALIQTGVPSVLGFRHPVGDASAQSMSLEFYQALAQRGDLDRALLDARLRVASDRNDNAWLTPVLIIQE